MTTATQENHPTAPSKSLADLLRQLGNIPTCRVWLNPPPDTATAEDAIVTRSRRWPENSSDPLPRGHGWPGSLIRGPKRARPPRSPRLDLTQMGDLLDGGDVISGLRIAVEDLSKWEDD